VKLSAALGIVAGAGKDLPVKSFFLACGFTPLHLQTFLTAHLQLAHPGARVNVATGLFGDLAGNIARIAPGQAAAIVLEWSDLDPRLGFRALGGWSASGGADVLQSAAARLQALGNQILRVSQSSPLTVVLPCSPLAPVSFAPHWMADRITIGIRRVLAEFAARILEADNVRLLNNDALALFAGETFQLKAELEHGFPYSLPYADFLAETIALGLGGLKPKKGLITDLDDTLWAGILGEDGLDGVRWSLEHHAQTHGLYQQMLASLAESGVLLAVASKNDSRLVEEAFAKLALVVKPDTLFPRVAHWGPKSQSVRSILKAWNIGAADVVFVDDSPTELEEAQTAFPELTCLQFKALDAAYSHGLLLQLRNLFGKERLQAEDALRAITVRTASRVLEEREAAAGEDEFLQGLGATLTMSVETRFAAGRALELLNKTNQFNLNGRRYELTDWAALESDPGRLLLVVEYADKHGSLGKISVLSGVKMGDAFKVDAWVMSCRAFSRRIEHAVIEFLFREFGLRVIELAYAPTAKNAPFAEFLRQVAATTEPGPARIDRDFFARQRPPLFHEIKAGS
jgi:FkbH-like protein